MRDAHRRLGLVHVLATGSRSPVGIDPQVLLADLDFGVILDVGQHLDQGERRMAAMRRVERGKPHQPVRAGLPLDVPVGVGATDLDGRALDAGLLALADIEHLSLVASALRPAQVHPEQHLGPVLRVHPAGPGMDRQDGILRVVRAAQHEPQLELVKLARELLDLGSQLSLEVIVVPSQLGQLLQIARLAGKRLPLLHLLAELAQPSHGPLGTLRVVPEFRIGAQLFKLGDLPALAREVKDAPRSDRVARGSPATALRSTASWFITSGAKKRLTSRPA
ncbi:hypothetical protein HRbin26_00816 [bacterium HR26]|nr:hypothetical protein HRbin26_00816 [bacterium HR26]